MKFNYKKSLKFVTMLVTALLIAIVSAQIYNYMYIDGSVSFTTGTGLKWVQGADAPSGTSIAGATVTLPFTARNGTVANYTYCLYLQNLDNSSHSILISVTNDATASYYNEFNMFIFNNATGTQIDVVNLLTTDSYSGTVGALAVWRLTFEVYTKSTTTSGSDTFDIQFRYE
ncbi:hypothetical protein HXY32_01315 [Candidatus Bathyarchaeota archaeon]|nr:hypothetical protein [Candidatus Bathyarchaeota archaeon]